MLGEALSKHADYSTRITAATNAELLLNIVASAPAENANMKNADLARLWSKVGKIGKWPPYSGSFLRKIDVLMRLTLTRVGNLTSASLVNSC